MPRATSLKSMDFAKTVRPEFPLSKRKIPLKFSIVLAVSAIAASPTLAETARQLDAHEHGVGQLDVAFDGAEIAMELHAPGADVVGFEYAATSAEDRKAVDAAVATLARPLDLFVLPGAAGCSVVQASASLASEDDHEEHDDHDHDDHDDEAHDHDDHDEHDHDEHGHDDDHEDHEKDAGAHTDGHTEFHAEYLLTCADPSKVTDITFAYFKAFPNALEVEVQVISDSGASAFEVERDAPVLDLRGMF